MNYLVGLTADWGRDALALGRMLARTGDVTLIVHRPPRGMGSPSGAWMRSTPRS